MDLAFTPEEQNFRNEVRTFVHANLPKDLSDKILTGKRLLKDDFLRWHKILFRQGWVAHTWSR